VSGEVEAVAAALGCAETVIEVGAFDGSIAERIVNLLPEPPVRWYAFECDQRNLPGCLAAPVYRRPGFEVVPCAVGERDGVTTLHPSSADDQEWTASSSICGPAPAMADNFPWLRYRSEHRVQVPMRSLDSFAAERGIGGVDLLWVDVEGAERRVIEGARAVLARTRLLFLEVWEARIFEGMWTYAETLAALPEFEVVQRFTGDVLLRRR
jgi:FkbM family methyltransferase